MMERLKRGWPALIVVAAIAWQYRAPLVGRVWCFEDIAAWSVPLWTAAARAMRHGAFPTWDLGAWSGQPLVGDPQLAVFYPPQWLWMVMRPLRLYAWLSLFHVAVGAGGMWALARARGRSTAAAAVAALALALGAFCVLELRHSFFVATLAWLPWLLWALERWAQTRSIEHALWIGVTLALAILAGGWSMLPFGFVVVGVFALGAIARSDARRRVAVGLAAATALGVALAAVQLFPAVAHARLSPRALGTTYEFASSYAWPSWRYLVTLLVPTWYGDVARGDWHGGDDQWELCGYGVGVVAGVLALASLALADGRRRERIALFVVVALAADIALGAHGLLHPLLHRVPPFSSLRCPARALFVYALAAPVLAADGLDAMARGRLAPARPFLVAAVAVELLITWRSDNPSTTVAAADAHPAAIDWLHGHRRPGRIVNDVHLGQPMHNMGLRWGLESAGGYHSLPIWRYLHLLWIANHGTPYPRAQLGDDLSAQGLWRFGSPVVDALGVTYVIAPHDRPVDAPGFTRVFTGDDGVDVWDNDQAFPSAYIVYRALYAASEADAIAAVADPRWRPGRWAIVEEPIDVPPPTPAPSPAPTRPTMLIREGPTSLVLEMELAQAGVLVIAEPWYPGWHVTVDGKAAHMLRVDYALRGVALPAGPHVVAWELSCPPLQAGGVVTLSSLALLAWLTARDARRRRRR